MLLFSWIIKSHLQLFKFSCWPSNALVIPPFIPHTHTRCSHCDIPWEREALPLTPPSLGQLRFVPSLMAPLIRLVDEVPPRHGRIINVWSRTGSTPSSHCWLSAERSGWAVLARPPCLFHSSPHPSDKGRVNLWGSVIRMQIGALYLNQDL